MSGNDKFLPESPIKGHPALAGILLDQLANLHFHFTSVPRCTPMVWRYNGTPMEILHLVFSQLCPLSGIGDLVGFVDHISGNVAI